MTPLATLGTYATGLVLVFGAAVGVGRVTGPVGTAPAPDAMAGMDGMAMGGADGAPEERLPAGGLSVSQDGYTLQLARPVVPAGAGVLQFAVAGPDGERLTDFEEQHTKELHLVVVRRDGTGFQHLHPARDATGRWSVPLTLAAPGSYKVVADFVPGGRETPLALAADLTVPGEVVPAPLPTEQRTARLPDGYAVTVSGELTAGTSSELVMTVTKDGELVEDLEPYLGAYGHLVALRSGDLAYLHVHPSDEVEATPGPRIPFAADVPAEGVHRLFLEFRHDGVVRTASFVVEATR